MCVVAVYYAPTLTEVAPAWVAVAAGVALLLYQTLDNMDGKQARRTGSSSPLGLLFDHGCDAFVCSVLGPLILGSVTGSGQGGPLGVVLFWALPSLLFFGSTWEHYHVHTFVLPPVNGPNEGLLVMAGAYFVSGAVGGSLWARPSPAWAVSGASAILAGLGYGSLAPAPASLTLLDVAVAVLALGVAATLGGNIAAVAGASSGVAAPLRRALPMLALLVVAVGWVSQPGTSAVVAASPLLFHLALSFAFTTFAASLMLAHVAGEEPPLDGRAGLPIALLAAPLAGVGAPGLCCLLALSAATVGLSRFVHAAVTEIAAELKIRVFTITPKLK